MIKNYLKTAFRKLRRQKIYAAINIVGFSLGLSCALVIFRLIDYASSFDSWHRQGERIYRVVTDNRNPNTGAEGHTAGTPVPLGPAIVNEFPQIEKMARVFYLQAGLITIPGVDGATPSKYDEEYGVTMVEPAFFEIFNFPWARGSSAQLKDPFTVAISETYARKYFGNADPIGKSIRLDNTFDLTVVGVVRDFPENTDYPFSVIISLASYEADNKMGFGMSSTHWGNITSQVNTVVLLQKGASVGEIDRALPALDRKYYDEPQNYRTFRLQSLSDIHFDQRYGTFGQESIPRSMLATLALIGLFLIVTACINFVNLATAESLNRSREIGVRKVLGAGRTQLISQFLGETFIITSISTLISLGAVEFLMPSVASLLQWKMSGFLSIDGRMAATALIVSLSVCVLAGIYPGVLLTRFRPVLVLKGGGQVPGVGMNIRRGLVVLQFAISQMLIIGTLIASYQMDYFRTKDLGYVKDAIVTVPLPENDKARVERLKSELKKVPAVINASAGYASGSSQANWFSRVTYASGDKLDYIVTNMRTGDTDYIATLGLQLVAGRTYAASDTFNEVVVNETFVKRMGLSDPSDAIGRSVRLGQQADLPIVGVVKDWHTQPLQFEMPACLVGTRLNSYREVSIKINMAASQEGLAAIEKTWTGVFPDYVFDYEFLDETIAKFYETEHVISVVFRTFAGIAVVIGCLGLLGLISFMAEKRTKEIGIRKVLGASMIDILNLFGWEFLKLVLLAFVVAAPVAYVVMNGWLEDFHYRISIGADVFFLTIGVTLGIALITVGYRAYRAAASNPVEALKYE